MQTTKPGALSRHLSATTSLLAAVAVSLLLGHASALAETVLEQALAVEAPAERLAALALALSQHPTDALLAGAYRMEARTQGVDARPLLEELVGNHKEALDLATHLGLAHLDHLALTTDQAQAGIDANRCTRVLTRVLRQEGGHWGARYGRALSHLVWASQMRHARYAVEDLGVLLEELALDGSVAPDAFGRVYLALGDAHVKTVSGKDPKPFYALGFAADPTLEALRDRSKLESSELVALINEQYRMTAPPDTDIGFLARIDEP